MAPARRDLGPLLAEAPWVRALALQLCADVHTAEDAAQDTLAAALRHPPDDPSRTRSFLARTLRNVLAMASRSQQRRLTRERQAIRAADEPADVGELVARAELHRQLVSSVLALPPAWREVVLRHYYEGETVATIARRGGTTPDAVRAQLRRARDRLRSELERGGGEAARAFALLSTRLGVPSEVAVGSATAAAAGSVAAWSVMNLKIACGVAAAAAALWLMIPLSATPVEVTAAPSSGGPTAVASAAADGPPSTVAGETPPRVAVDVPAGETIELPGRVVGLHPQVPWTTRLALRRAGSERAGERAAIDVAPDGTFVVAMPAENVRGAPAELRLEARDPFYLPAEARLRAGASTREPIELCVEPASVVTGRVVDRHGEGVQDVLVGAFVAGIELRPLPGADVWMRCSTHTDARGGYRLQVPAIGAMRVLAVAMRQVPADGRGRDGPGAARPPLRDDLLPASARVTTAWGRVCEVPALVLHEPAYVSGSVTNDDGTPVAGVEVMWIPGVDGAESMFDRALGNLMSFADGSSGRVAFATTDAHGRFRLPAATGRSGTCHVLDANGATEPLVDIVSAIAPAELEIRLLADAVVRVLCEGRPVEGVAVVMPTSVSDRLTPSDRQRRTDGKGEVRLRRNQRGPLEVRRPGGQQIVVELPADVSPVKPLVVELPPLPAAPVRIELDASTPIGAVEVGWQRLDAPGVPLTFLLDDGADAARMQCDVPPGRYELIAASPLRGTPREGFLIQGSHEVEVPPQGCAVRLQLTHGGRVRISLTDADGRHATGFARLTGSAGQFSWLLPSRGPEDGPTVPAGKYELEVRCVGKLQRRSVEVHAREVADVRIRLP